MDYIFGTVARNGVTVENLKTVGEAHTDLDGFQQVVRKYPDSIAIDNFRIVEKYHTDTDAEGTCYDWYIIDSHNSYVDKYTPAAATVQQAQEAAAITFVTLAETGSVDAVTAAEHADLFSPWAYPIAYTEGQLRQYNGRLYRCISAHTSQADWTPDTAVSLWKEAADPAEEWPEWSQPVGAFDAYPQGAKVTHKGQHYTSDIDNNVWEPGVYGWTEAANE